MPYPRPTGLKTQTLCHKVTGGSEFFFLAETFLHEHGWPSGQKVARDHPCRPLYPITTRMCHPTVPEYEPGALPCHPTVSEYEPGAPPCQSGVGAGFQGRRPVQSGVKPGMTMTFQCNASMSVVILSDMCRLFSVNTRKNSVGREFLRHFSSAHPAFVSIIKNRVPRQKGWR